MLKDEHTRNEDYENAMKGLNKLGMRIMGEYHELYLKTDVFLLTDIFVHKITEICS